MWTQLPQILWADCASRATYVEQLSDTFHLPRCHTPLAIFCLLCAFFTFRVSASACRHCRDSAERNVSHT